MSIYCRSSSIHNYIPRHWTPGEAVSDVIKHHECILTIGLNVDIHVGLVEGTDNGEKHSHQAATEDEQRSSTPSIGEVPSNRCGRNVRYRVCTSV